MTRRLKRIGPMQAGKVLGILYGVIGLIFVPFFVVAAVLGAFAEQGQADAAAGVAVAGGMILMAVLFPIMYAVFGFVGGVIMAAVYNLIARWVGGLELEFEDVPSS